MSNKRLTAIKNGGKVDQHPHERSQYMLGSYSAPHSYANEAIQLLKEAYYETPETSAKSLILKAIDAISQLKDEIKGFSQQELSNFDSYEFDESNSAM